MIQGKGRIRTDVFGLGQSMLKLVLQQKMLCTVVLRRKACRADLRSNFFHEILGESLETFSEKKTKRVILCFYLFIIIAMFIRFLSVL